MFEKQKSHLTLFKQTLGNNRYWVLLLLFFLCFFFAVLLLNLLCFAAFASISFLSFIPARPRGWSSWCNSKDRAKQPRRRRKRVLKFMKIDEIQIKRKDSEISHLRLTKLIKNRYWMKKKNSYVRYKCFKIIRRFSQKNLVAFWVGFQICRRDFYQNPKTTNAMQR